MTKNTLSTATNTQKLCWITSNLSGFANNLPEVSDEQFKIWLDDLSRITNEMCALAYPDNKKMVTHNE